MVIATLFLFSLGILGCQAIDCPQNGWSQAEDICYRIVHFPESFWSAYRHCETFGGNLLQLKNVKQVMDALGTTMEGNADEFRIDGIANGTWYQRKTETLDHMHKDYELLSSLKDKTLTLNVQDGRVSGNTDKDVRIGFICEGGEGMSGECGGAEERGEKIEVVPCNYDNGGVAFNNDATTDLETAIKAKDLAGMETAMKQGANPSKSGLLMGFIEEYQVRKEAVLKLIGMYCSDVNFHDGRMANVTPLMWAAQTEDSDLLKAILRRGVDDIDSVDDHGETALHNAAKYCRKHNVMILVANGADPAAKTKEGRTPLNLAENPNENEQGYCQEGARSETVAYLKTLESSG